MPTLHQLLDLTGRSALITGGSGYLGAALAEALAEAGASVVVGSRKLDRAERAAANLPSSGNQRHHGVELDHKNDDSLQSAAFAMLPNEPAAWTFWSTTARRAPSTI